MPGRRPKPTALKILQGTVRPDRLNRAEPRPRPGIPPCPRWLLPEARREWRRVVRALGGTGVITQADRAMLAAYCQLWAKFVAGETGAGPVLGSAGIAQMRALASAFGLEPASRARLHAPAQEQAQDEFEAFMQDRAS